MAKLNVFLIIIFFTVLSLLAVFNKDAVNVTIWKGVTYEGIPVIALIFVSTAVGILSMFIVATIRDAKRYVNSWQVQRHHKKEAKMQETYSKGLDAFFASRYDEAFDQFTHIIAHDQAHLNALLRLGDIALYKKDFTKAKEHYLTAKEIKPRNIEVLLSLEKVFAAQHKWQDAIKYLDDVLEIDDENIKVLNKKKSIYEKNNKWEEVLDVQHKILKCKLPPEVEKTENEKLLGYKYELGRFYLEAGPVDKAIKMLRGVVKQDQSFIAAYFALADAYEKEGNSKEVREVLMKGYEVTSSLVILARLEDHFIAEGEPGTIIELYQKAVQKDRKDSRLQFFLAKLYLRLEMIDHAMDTVNLIDMTSFNFPDMHVLLGSIYERRSENKKALEEFKKALNTDNPAVVPFCCSNCDFISREWSDRCPECKEWNTFLLDINEVCKIQKRQISS